MLIISQQIDGFKPQALPPPELFVPPVLLVQPATSSCHTKPSQDDWDNPPAPDAKPGPTKAGAIERIYKPVKNRKWEKLSPEEARAVRSARRSVRSESGKKLPRQRGRHRERSFAHRRDAGGVRRTTWSGLAGWIKNKAAAFFRTPFFGLRKTYFSTGC